jgi:hypothetical protein
MSKMFDIAPVRVVVEMTVTKMTEGGLLGGFRDVEVMSANGETDPRFYGFSDFSGRMVLNFKAEGRPAKPAKPAKAAPKAIPPKADLAGIPANGTKTTKGAKTAKAAPKAPEAPDTAAIVAAVMAALNKG